MRRNLQGELMSQDNQEEYLEQNMPFPDDQPDRNQEVEDLGCDKGNQNCGEGDDTLQSAYNNDDHADDDDIGRAWGWQ